MPSSLSLISTVCSRLLYRENQEQIHRAMNTRTEAGNISAVIFIKNLRKKASNNNFDVLFLKREIFEFLENLIAL